MLVITATLFESVGLEGMVLCNKQPYNEACERISIVEIYGSRFQILSSSSCLDSMGD